MDVTYRSPGKVLEKAMISGKFSRSITEESCKRILFPLKVFSLKHCHESLIFAPLTLMKFKVLEFDSDIKNRICYALNIYSLLISLHKCQTHVAALLFELLLSLHVAVCTFIFTWKWRPIIFVREYL